MTNNSVKVFSNQSDYPLLREFLSQLMRSNPYSQYGVHGVGVGAKVVAGEATDQLVIRFHVASKIPPSRLLPEQHIPDTFQYFSQRDNREVAVKTDVIESPPGTPHTDPESVVRPVPGGVSCSGHGDMWAGTGTIGGWVWDNTDDSIVMLSNQHVFGNAAGTPIIQPGSQDGGAFPQDQIGQVKRSIPLIPVPIGQEPVPGDCNFVDAAIADLDNSDNFDLTVLEIGPAVYEVDSPVIGMTVEKFGQTTGHTVGEITDLPYNVLLSYPVEGDVALCDCFRYETNDPTQLPLSSQGDSGALVFQQGAPGVIKPVVGLLLGGGKSANNNWTIACQITNVFSALNLGPLCIAGCPAFVDALYADGADGGGEAQLDITDISPDLFATKERQRQRARSFHTQLTLDLQKRFLTSQRGRGVIGFINRHRNELTTLVVNDGEAQRAIVSALRPILVGASTTTDVLEHKLTEFEVDQLNELINVWDSRGSASLRKSLKVFQALLDGATGRSLAEILAIKM